MQSLILTATTRLLFPVMLVGSLWVLLRGHNEPGGGFIGGLIAAAAFSTLAMAEGPETARRRMMFHPMVIVGAGLLIAFVSGLPGLVFDASFFTHQWGTLNLGITYFKVSTALTFDIGVYLVVAGSVLAFMLRLYAEDGR